MTTLSSVCTIVTMSLRAGLDVGTSGIKAVVIDRDDGVVAMASSVTPWERVHSGAQMSPQALFEVVRTVLIDLVSQLPAKHKLASLGVTGIAEAGVLFVPDRAPPPIIAWFDSRGDDQAARLEREHGVEFTRATGLPRTTLSTLVKIRWMADEWGAPVAGASWYSVAEWVVQKLGGTAHSEWSLASRTGLLDLRTGKMWAGAFGYLDIDPSDAPALLRSPSAPDRAQGALVDGPAALIGAQLLVAGLDHLAAAEACDATDPGVLFDSCGTAEAMMRFFDDELLSDDLVMSAVDAGLTIGRHTKPSGFVAIGVVPSGLILESIKQPSRGSEAESIPEGLKVVGHSDESRSIEGVPPEASLAAVWRTGLDEAFERSSALAAKMSSIFGVPERVVVTGGWMKEASFKERKLRQFPTAVRDKQLESAAAGAAVMAGRAGPP